MLSENTEISPQMGTICLLQGTLDTKKKNGDEIKFVFYLTIGSEDFSVISSEDLVLMFQRRVKNVGFHHLGIRNFNSAIQ